MTDQKKSNKSYIEPEKYLEALTKQFEIAKDTYFHMVVNGGFNFNNSEIRSASENLNEAARSIYAFREEERKREIICEEFLTSV